MIEDIYGTLLNLGLPAAGVVVYWRICRKMIGAGIPEPPVLSFFFLFAHYGAWLILGLTVVSWYWSGMASLGVAYLLFISPAVMLVVTASTFADRQLSPF